jgi:site-specific recombinase XerD
MTALTLTPAPLKDRTIEERVLSAALSGLSRNSCRAYTRHLKLFLSYLAATKLPLNRETVESFMATAPPYAAYNQALSAIKRLAMQAAAHGWIAYETAVQIDSIRTKKRLGQLAGAWLTIDQAKALLAAPDAATVAGKRDLAVLALLIGCGLRREEAAGLSWLQFDKREDRWMLLNIEGKGGRIRTVAVPRWAAEILHNWRHELPSTEFGYIVRSFTPQGKINGSLSATAIWDIVLAYATKIGVKCSPHDLRRTYAKLARKGGAPLDVIQKSLGHSSVRTTELYTASGEEANAGDYLKL